MNVHDSAAAHFEATIIALFPALRYRPENVGGDKEPGVSFMELFALPARQAAVTLGSTWVREQGIFQVAFWTPSGGGAGEATGYAAALQAAFLPGSSFQADGFEVRITEASRGPALEEPGWYHLPVSIYWHSFHPNT